MKKRKKGLIFVIVIILVVGLVGCLVSFGDDSESDYDYGYDYDHELENYANQNENYDEYEEHYEDYDFYGTNAPENTNLNVWDYELGTCGELEGKTLLVSVFLNDTKCNWENNTDVIYDALKYTGIATNWISESVATYGCNSEFIYDWRSYSDLYYEGTVDVDMTDTENNSDYLDFVAWKFIDENIDSKSLLQKYNADNIGYLLYLNTLKSNHLTSCTRNYYEGMEYPYEMCFVYMFCDNEEECPAGIAHEILHMFGAPDLYLEDTNGDNYGVSRQLVNELERTKSNDIMYVTYDPIKNILYYDKVSNDFTELDAYYVGIADSCDLVEKWNLGPSQHNK